VGKNAEPERGKNNTDKDTEFKRAKMKSIPSSHPPAIWGWLVDVETFGDSESPANAVHPDQIRNVSNPFLFPIEPENGFAQIFTRVCHVEVAFHGMRSRFLMGQRW
jgi:hypothetical protein